MTDKWMASETIQTLCRRIFMVIFCDMRYRTDKLQTDVGLDYRMIHALHPERSYSPMAGCLITIRCHAQPSSSNPRLDAVVTVF